MTPWVLYLYCRHTYTYTVLWSSSQELYLYLYICVYHQVTLFIKGNAGVYGNRGFLQLLKPILVEMRILHFGCKRPHVIHVREIITAEIYCEMFEIIFGLFIWVNFNKPLNKRNGSTISIPSYLFLLGKIHVIKGVIKSMLM